MACPTFHMPLSKNRVPLKIPAVYHVLPSCSPLRYTCWLILIYHIRRYIPIMPLYMALKLGGHPSGWLHSRESESLICSFHRRRIMYCWTVGWFSAMPKIVISQFIAFYHAPKWLLFFFGPCLDRWWQANLGPSCSPERMDLCDELTRKRIEEWMEMPMSSSAWQEAVSGTLGNILSHFMGVVFWWHSMSTHANHGE